MICSEKISLNDKAVLRHIIIQRYDKCDILVSNVTPDQVIKRKIKPMFRKCFIILTAMLAMAYSQNSIAADKSPKMLTDSIPYKGVFSFGKNKGYIQLPENYDPLKKYPLILFLYGRGGSALNNNFISNEFKVFREKVYRSGYIVAVPGYGTDLWFNESAENITLEMLDFLNKKLSLTQKHYVIGCSMGGGSALVFAAKHKEKVNAVCDIFGVTDYSKFYNEGNYQGSIAKAYGGSPSEKSQVYQNRSAINYIDDLKDIPILVIHGDRDSIVHQQHSDLLVEKLKQANGKVEYIVVPGKGHQNAIIKNLEDRIISFGKKR
ncbi:MAG: prolyl oligopeptidase family serine peptidase [Victivallaceae bacterium]|nr:prolyl oligopeptidase family serine peptidase [Victivallaceae bacterium]